MKRSHEPLFWALFGAGGMLAALLGPVLVFITGLAVPLGVLPARMLDYAHVRAFVAHPPGALAVLVVIPLLLFHGCHRLLHSLHDLGVRTGLAGKLLFYGFAILGTLVTAGLLVAQWRA